MNARDAKRRACQIASLLVDQCQSSSDGFWDDDEEISGKIDEALSTLSTELWRRGSRYRQGPPL